MELINGFPEIEEKLNVEQLDNYDGVISFENLYKAHRRARLGKRHKKEVIDFELNLSENLWKIHNELKYQEYEVGEYHKFMIYDPKEREIQAISYRDRIVQHCICDNYFTPLLEKHLIYTNVACRKDKGTDFAVKYIRKCLTKISPKRTGNECYLKIDISKYFNSIDHEVLKGKIKGIVKDERIIKLLYKIIDSYAFIKGKGLPMGNQTSQNFALLYLSNIDRYIKEKLRINYYLRYMDDMVIFFENKEKAKNNFLTIKEKIEEERLAVNPKSQIALINRGINFLAWNFKFSQSGKIIQTIKKETRKRILIKCKTKVYFANRENMIERIGILASYESYKGLLVKRNIYCSHFMNKVSKILLKEQV